MSFQMTKAAKMRLPEELNSKKKNQRKVAESRHGPIIKNDKLLDKINAEIG